tara:strand:- start:371 stop:526 length:156 start_codon:yes stop_codon:yes gene_type:complete
MDIYSRDKIIEILEKVLVVEQFKQQNDPPILADDNEDYDKPVTRSHSLATK